MERIIAAFLLWLTFAAPALADGRAFPPDDCSATSPFMAFNGTDTNGNTYCRSGQDIMRHAIPACAADQIVAWNGTSFYCKDAATPPECAAGEFLTFTGGAYGCGSTDVPTCGANQVLSFNGSAFICVTKSDSIPTCGESQFLTYNGSTFQCAATQTLSIPSCAAGEVLTGSGGSLVCAASSGAMGQRSCPAGTPPVGGSPSCNLTPSTNVSHGHAVTCLHGGGYCGYATVRAVCLDGSLYVTQVGDYGCMGY